MRAGGGYGQTDPIGGGAELGADAEHLAFDLSDVLANRGADLDDRLVHLALDLVAERG